MAKPAKFKEIKTGDIKEALNLISFPVERVKTLYQSPTDNKTIPFPGREIIMRTDTGVPFEVLSNNYQIVKHEDAFNAAVEGLRRTGIPFSLQSIALDKDGAKMMARFQFEKEYPITEGVDLHGGIDILRPELTLVNSYDGGISLGFDLGSFRLVCLNLAQAKIADVRARWTHLGNSANPENLKIAAKNALETFENVIVPMYRQMAETELSKQMAEKAVVAAIKKEIIPMRLGKFAVHCVTSDRALEKEKNLKRSLWTLFNALTWTTTHQFEGSPSRRRDLEQSVANAFKDGGKSLLEAAKKIDAEEVAEWLKKASEAA